MLAFLKNKGKTKITLDQLDRFMKNVGDQEFTFDLLKSAFDFDPRIQNIVKDFDQTGITLKSDTDINTVASTDSPQSDTVKKMAQRATKLGK